MTEFYHAELSGSNNLSHRTKKLLKQARQSELSVKETDHDSPTPMLVVMNHPDLNERFSIPGPRRQYNGDREIQYFFRKHISAEKMSRRYDYDCSREYRASTEAYYVEEKTLRRAGIQLLTVLSCSATALEVGTADELEMKALRKRQLARQQRSRFS